MLAPLGRRGRILAVLLSIFIAAGCSSGSGSAAVSGTLGTALGHVADTANNRGSIYFDDTAELYRLTGPSPNYGKGFAPLIGWGASDAGQYQQVLSGDTGIDLSKESWAISAGLPPAMATLVDGGQDASLITSRLTRLGWKQAGGSLAGPSPTAASGNGAYYALFMATVRASGADVAFGGSGASLAQVGSPSGATLASNPQVSALASCLGSVVAAFIQVGGNLGGRSPSGLALGVRTPVSNTATPQAVACVAWPTQAAADQFATDVRDALSTGKSAARNESYATLLPHSSVTIAGGGQNIVQWQASMPGALEVFQMLEARDLPALPDCGRLRAFHTPGVYGCP